MLVGSFFHHDYGKIWVREQLFLIFREYSSLTRFLRFLHAGLIAVNNPVEYSVFVQVCGACFLVAVSVHAISFIATFIISVVVIVLRTFWSARYSVITVQIADDECFFRLS